MLLAVLAAARRRSPSLRGILADHDLLMARLDHDVHNTTPKGFNTCGQSPMDFESITLATRSHCLGMQRLGSRYVCLQSFVAWARVDSEGI